MRIQPAIFAISLALGITAPAAMDSMARADGSGARADDSGAIDRHRPGPVVAPPGRLVPAYRDHKLVGFKVYAIRPGGGRYAAAGMENGDTIEAVDGVAVTAEADAAKVTAARVPVNVTVRRHATQLLVLTISAS